MNNDIESGDNQFPGGEVIPPGIGLPCGKEDNTDWAQPLTKTAAKLRTARETEQFRARLQNDHRDRWAKLYLSLIGFIKKQAAKYAGPTVGRQRQDLEQEGAFALRKALKTFDPKKNAKLETYACTCIKHAMIDYMRKHHPIDSKAQSLEELLEDPKSNAALSFHLIHAKRTISEEDKRLSELVRKNLGILTPREQEVLIHRYGLKDGEQKTQVQVANLVGVSQARVAEIEKAVIDKLKRKLAGSS